MSAWCVKTDWQARMRLLCWHLSRVTTKAVFSGFRPDQIHIGLLGCTEKIKSWKFRFNSCGRQQTTKTSLRLRWSAPLSFAYGMNRFYHDEVHLMTNASVISPLKYNNRIGVYSMHPLLNIEFMLLDRNRWTSVWHQEIFTRLFW